MCIICHKPAGVEMPTEEDIRYMFQKNPDGAGYAVAGWFDDDKGGKIFTTIYEKGFMKVDDLLKAIHKLGNIKDKDFVLHCRIKTSGKVDPATCHPFRVDAHGYRELRKTSGPGHILLFHNGVFAGLGGICNPNSSDTQDFTLGIASRYLKSAEHFGKMSEKVVEEFRGPSRILVMYPSPDHTIRRLGDWHEHNGLYYSNTNYRGYYDTVYSGRYGKGWGDDDDQSALVRAHYSISPREDKDTHDEWGASIYEYAWPSSNDQWIICQSKARFEILMKAAEEVEYDEDVKCGTCKFRSTGRMVWFFDEDRMEFWTEAKDEDRSLRLDEEEYMEEYGISSDGDVMVFDDELIMDDFFHTKASTISGYTAVIKGKTWYLDIVNLEAYTWEGIKRCFKPGDAGHIKKLLETEGTYMENPTYQNRYGAEYQIPDDDDDKAWEELRKEMEEEERELNGLPMGGA